MIDMKTRPLTAEELSRLRERLARLNLPHSVAAKRIGTSSETLAAAFDGKRIQPAKRAMLLEEK
jgi:hypothetical protein